MNIESSVIFYMKGDNMVIQQLSFESDQWEDFVVNKSLLRKNAEISWLNLSSANPTKWSTHSNNSLATTNTLNVFEPFAGLALEGLRFLVSEKFIREI